MLRGAVVDLAPLRHRDFRLLSIGRAVSFLGAMVTYVAVPYQVFKITHSSLDVGLLGLAEIVPLVVAAVIGGALADAHDRRRQAWLTEIGAMACSGALLANAALPHPRLAPLYVITAVMATLEGLQRPALEAMVPRLVPREDLKAAGAVGALRMTVGMIAGPAIGGILIATTGLRGAYTFDVASFTVSLVTLALMHAAPPPIDAEPPSVRRVVEGFRYARSRPELIGTYLVDINAMFFGMPTALFPALAVSFGGARALGWIYAAPAVGSLVATTSSGWTRRVHRHGSAVLWAATAWGLAIVAFGFAHSLWVAFVFLALAGAADMVSGIFRMVIWNETIPDALRGRLAGIEQVSYSVGPAFGNVEAGGVASAFSVRTSIVSGGVLCVLGSVILGATLPAFRRYDGRDVDTPDVDAPDVDAPDVDAPDVAEPVMKSDGDG
jgi:MFS family permease